MGRKQTFPLWQLWVAVSVGATDRRSEDAWQRSYDAWLAAKAK